MKLIDTLLLDEVSREAKASPRLRMNRNFHETLDARAQRLLNALEPGTILPIHRHTETAETYIVLRGEIKIKYYHESGALTEEVVLNPLSGKYGVHIPAGQWHTLEVLEEGSVIFEVKDGPYIPLDKKNMMEV